MFGGFESWGEQARRIDHRGGEAVRRRGSFGILLGVSVSWGEVRSAGVEKSAGGGDAGGAGCGWEISHCLTVSVVILLASLFYG
jgi:hypothetical protein